MRIRNPMHGEDRPGLTIQERKTSDYIEFGFARPRVVMRDETIPLGYFIKCMRGIATGANSFFFFTEEKIHQKGLPKEFFVRAVGRTRDVPTDELTQKVLSKLDHAGRPTWLLNLRGYTVESLPESLRKYIREGEGCGLPGKPLIRQRRAWFWIEQRTPPPFLFAYLGRRNVRFIRNKTGAQALTGFLCVYPQPRYSSPKALEVLWQCMKHPQFLCNLDLVAKTYGGGALKVEPRALERTPVPLEAVRPLLRLWKPSQEIQLEEKTLVEHQ